jgi:CheY-like chemotaxis protein
LISNALKFTEHGEVRVAAAPGPGDAEVTFTVTDTGIGIAAADQVRIFEEFGQVENPVQRRVRGTGLGLPLTKKLAELLGGRVHLTSTPGLGSSFAVTIPRVYAEPTEPRKPLPPQRLRPGVPVLVVEDSAQAWPRRLLVIDDDEISRYLVRGLLPEDRYVLSEAPSGPEGLRLARETRPAAILLDLVMPGMSGLEVLDQLRGDPATQEIPVIVITSKVLEHEERRRMAGSVVAVLSKDAPSREDAARGILEALIAAGVG